MPLVSTLKFSTQRRRWQGDQDSSALRQLDCEDLADAWCVSLSARHKSGAAVPAKSHGYGWGYKTV